MRKPRTSTYNKIFAGIGFFALTLVCTLVLPKATIKSANLTTTKDTLQSSRLSVAARINAAGTVVGGSNVQIKSAAVSPYYTIDTANMRAGDSVVIGSHTYTIVGITDATNFTVTPVLLTGDTVDATAVYIKQAPQHVVTFNTASAVPDGFFQILLPSNATTGDDGNPDPDGFDFNTSVAVAGTNATGYTFVTGVATASGALGCTAPVNYHCFEVHYSGSGGIGTAITIKVGNTTGVNTPLAPAPSSTHANGTADTYSFIVKNFAAGANPNTATAIDQTTGKIGVIEAVRVTATVLPTISLVIAGHAASGTVCGVTPNVDTTTGVNAPLAVPFGSLANLNTFYNAVHQLTVSTNAASGYVVTTSESAPLSRDGLGVTTIADAPGNNNLMTNAVSDEWTTTTKNGFGFSLQNISAAIPAFLYTTATGNCTGTFCARQFANIAGAATPQTIFSSTTVANAESVYVCYRLNVGATQAAGNYENQIVYTATGSF
jgi:hypothetical protein